jgi:hypothetical protein
MAIRANLRWVVAIHAVIFDGGCETQTPQDKSE